MFWVDWGTWLFAGFIYDFWAVIAVVEEVMEL